MGVTGTRTIESPVGAQITIDGRHYLNFGGSSYLGLSGQIEIIAAATASLRTNGSGYQFARHFQLATGAHQDAEAEAAAFFGSESAIYLAGGYYFGFVALAAIRGEFGAVFLDELAHHCLREAVAASSLPSYTFRHLDAEDLRSTMQRRLRKDDKPLVVSDGMYSTFGEVAPLHDFMQVAAPYGGRLLVDESHSFGVLGASGRGACEQHGIAASSVVMGGSTSKAFGVTGGIIPATAAEVAAFRVTPAGRSASAGLPAAAAMCARSFRHVREHPELLTRLRDNVAYAKSRLRAIGLSVGDSIAPVATFATATEHTTRQLQERLMAEGIYVLLSNYIGASPSGVIRCGIFADHTHEHIDALADALRRLV